MNYFDLGVEIEHNLNEYPIVQIISKVTYGHGLYGMGTGLYYINNVPEYIDENKLKLFLTENFQGVPLVNKISDRKYNVNFSLEVEPLIIILR